MEKDKLGGGVTPPEIWRHIAGCIDAERYDDATFLFALAGARARFDTLRVADISAHDAAAILPMLLDYLPADKANAFREHIKNTLLKDEKLLTAYCAEIRNMGPPSYFPSYMVNHGLGVFRNGGNAQPLVEPFDEKSSWADAVNGYLRCPGTSVARPAAPRYEEAVVNAHPARVLRVFGTVDPSLTIKVRTSYFNFEGKCRQKNDVPEGGPESRPAWVESRVVRSGDSYDTQVVYDYFQDGTCHWYPYEVMFQVTNLDGLTTGYFSTVINATTHVADTRHIAAPSTMIWINPPGTADSPGHVAARSLAPLDVDCREHRWPGGDANSLDCPVTTSSLISQEATEVRLNLHDQTATPTAAAPPPEPSSPAPARRAD